MSGSTSAGARPLTSFQDVVEEESDVDGYHRSLCLVSRNGGESKADGAVWRETVNR